MAVIDWLWNILVAPWPDLGSTKFDSLVDLATLLTGVASVFVGYLGWQVARTAIAQSVLQGQLAELQHKLLAERAKQSVKAALSFEALRPENLFVYILKNDSEVAFESFDWEVSDIRLGSLADLMGRLPREGRSTARLEPGHDRQLFEVPFTPLADQPTELAHGSFTVRVTLRGVFGEVDKVEEMTLNRAAFYFGAWQRRIVMED